MSRQFRRTNDAARFGQKAVTVLLTGLTGSGKTVIGHAVERKLFDQGRAVSMIDGEIASQRIEP